jgi:multidrug resistance efflux pump
VIGEPVIRMADLRSMDVTCQVYEADLLKIRPGMRATIKNNAFAKPLNGVVRTVGRMVEARAKLGEVRIRLDNPSPANRLVGMEVEVVIGQ